MIIPDRQNMFLKIEMFYQLKLYLFGVMIIMMDHITCMYQQNCIFCLSPYDKDVYSGR